MTMERLTLQNILDGFNAPINEEQAWAVCYQCAKYLQGRWQGDRDQCYRFNRVHCLELNKDGLVSRLIPDDPADKAQTEYDLVQSLGVVVFQALDYGLSDAEEQSLSPPLEHLIARMTGTDREDEAETQIRNNTQLDVDGDEGIGNEAEDEDLGYHNNRMSFNDVIMMCTCHISNPLEAPTHYRAVCRALVAEAEELITFLKKISTEKSKLIHEGLIDLTDGTSLEDLNTDDWARLWIQVMRQLRNGVKLKKVEHVHFQSLEYELTPYEILMEDIRSRRYTLNKVMVNGDIPPQTKKDAHDVILEFIRSRPPLHPVKDRKLNSPPVKSPDVREQLLAAIRSEPKLKPTPGRVVETSRTRLDEYDDNPVPPRKVIKPDLSLLMSNSFDEDEEEEDEDDAYCEDRNKVSPCPMTPLSPLSPISPEKSPWQQSVDLDIASGAVSFRSERRHSITVCESPTKQQPHLGTVSDENSPPRNLKVGNGKPLVVGQSTNSDLSDQEIERSLQSSLECLSLTIEEVMHIRNVLTKAELECLLVDPELHQLVARGKVCFTCKKTRFALFGMWATKCKFCRRNVCTKCVTKMRIPTDHFEHIPVYTLSPSPLSPDSSQDLFVYEKTGSAPNSPEVPRKVFDISPPEIFNNNRNKRPALHRARTVTRAPPPRDLQGPLMNICKDCKAMIVNVIRASRTSLASTPCLFKEKSYIDCPSRRACRNFHLDLKPVYK